MAALLWDSPVAAKNWDSARSCSIIVRLHTIHSGLKVLYRSIAPWLVHPVCGQTRVFARRIPFHEDHFAGER